MRDVWDWTPPADVEIIDTLVLARLVNPAKGHNSLAAIAERAGLEQKQDFDLSSFDDGLSEEMIEYCLQDTRANWDAYRFLLKEYESFGFSGECLDLEHECSRIVRTQEENGFKFDWQGASAYYNQQKERMSAIEQELQETFEPIITTRFSDKLKDADGNPKRLKDHVEVFNPASRQQIAKRLEDKGIVWKKRTEKGNIIVDEDTLADVIHIPEAALVLEYLTLGKRSAMVLSWLNAYEEDGRIHGYVNTNGAVTGRMTHARPNMAQIPSDSDYRRFFIVPEGHKLVGCDASGLELRMLAHYMKDERFIAELLEGDIHTANQEAFGCATRDQAKTLIYALLYGAGDAKLGSVVGGSAAKGKAMRSSYENNWPAYRDLIKRTKKIAQCGTVPGLDGRRLHVRSEHAALNTLLQSAGAIVMKKALVIAEQKLNDYGYPYKFASVHDISSKYRTMPSTRNTSGKGLLRCPA